MMHIPPAFASDLYGTERSAPFFHCATIPRSASDSPQCDFLKFISVLPLSALVRAGRNSDSVHGAHKSVGGMADYWLDRPRAFSEPTRGMSESRRSNSSLTTA
jgi:hypothetical protein